MSAETFLERLPEKSVGSDGQVHNLRQDIADKIKGVVADVIDQGCGESEEEVKARKRREAVEAAERRMKQQEAGAAPAPAEVPRKTPQKLNSSLRRSAAPIAADVGVGEDVAVEEEGGGETTLRVRLNGRTVVLKMSCRAKVGELRGHIETELGEGGGQFEIRTAHPNKTYADDETLVDAGLCPNAAIIVRILKQ
jgi:hypothetical protein